VPHEDDGEEEGVDRERTALHLACEGVNVDVVELFIEKIPSTIQIAFQQGCLEIVRDVLTDKPEVSKNVILLIV
jgi:hypothetical protein